jgi:hypothetical protein
MTNSTALWRSWEKVVDSSRDEVSSGMAASFFTTLPAFAFAFADFGFLVGFVAVSSGVAESTFRESWKVLEFVIATVKAFNLDAS